MRGRPLSARRRASAASDIQINLIETLACVGARSVTVQQRFARTYCRRSQTTSRQNPGSRRSAAVSRWRPPFLRPKFVRIAAQSRLRSKSVRHYYSRFQRGINGVFEIDRFAKQPLSNHQLIRHRFHRGETVGEASQAISPAFTRSHCWRGWRASFPTRVQAV